MMANTAPEYVRVPGTSPSGLGASSKNDFTAGGPSDSRAFYIIPRCEDERPDGRTSDYPLLLSVFILFG